MLSLDIVRISTRLFRAKSLRTVLTIFGIGIGVGVILFLSSLSYGLQNLVLDKITRSGVSLELDINSGKDNEVRLNRNAEAYFRLMPDVDKVSVLKSGEARITYNEKTLNLESRYVKPDYFQLERVALLEGNYISEESPNQLVVSSPVLEYFNLSAKDALGEKIKLEVYLKESGEQGKKGEIVEVQKEFQIVGVVKENREKYFYSSNIFGNSLTVSDYEKIRVRVFDEKNIEGVKSEILKQGYLVNAISDVIHKAKRMFDIVQFVLTFFGVAALIIGVIGMFMTITFLERVYEIGIMKSLGATSVDIYLIFLSEAVIIGFLGGVSGIMFGVFGGQLANLGVNIFSNAAGGPDITLFHTPLSLMSFSVLIAVVVGLLTGAYSARRAVRIDCLRAMNYK